MTTEKITIYEQDSERPRKTTTPAGPPSSVTTHKARSAWFQARESWPLREAPMEVLAQERARAATEMARAPEEHRWSPVGPSNIGGRMTSVVCHPEIAEHIWAGAAGGGVWRSSDAGRTWQGLWHDEPSLNVGSLAIDPANPRILYCGTGEANLSADSHPGVGVMRSLDAGTTWDLLAPAATVGLPGRIGALAVDPFDSRHLLLGGVGHLVQGATGLFASMDGGTSWARQPLVGPSGYWCHAVHFHPTRRGLIFVTISARGSHNGIWRSSDSGASWEHLGGGLPLPDLIGRTSLALAPSDADVLYAQVEHRGAVLDIFRSADAGDTWKGIGGAHFADERQMSYGNTIVVHPLDADFVLCGGVDLHRTVDGGQHWRRVTKWNDERGTPGYAHADHHDLLMPAARPGWVYDLNDGGMDYSDDGGTTWQNRSDGLATT
ncbi:MAG: hypothetical protein M3422_25450, partial [Actinomycetota bacterium]|nr:hypothetical protein [Actinomycetota bacterium]